MSLKTVNNLLNFYVVIKWLFIIIYQLLLLFKYFDYLANNNNCNIRQSTKFNKEYYIVTFYKNNNHIK